MGETLWWLPCIFRALIKIPHFSNILYHLCFVLPGEISCPNLITSKTTDSLQSSKEHCSCWQRQLSLHSTYGKLSEIGIADFLPQLHFQNSSRREKEQPPSKIPWFECHRTFPRTAAASTQCALVNRG